MDQEEWIYDNRFGVLQNLELIEKWKYDFFNEKFTRADVKKFGLFCFMVIPCCMKGFKDVEHTCPQCHGSVAKYKRQEITPQYQSPWFRSRGYWGSKTNNRTGRVDIWRYNVVVNVYILRCYFLPFIFRYRSMALRTCVFHIFKSFHATRNYHKTKQSKPSA
jgi:hypothetical protein